MLLIPLQLFTRIFLYCLPEGHPAVALKLASVQSMSLNVSQAVVVSQDPWKSVQVSKENGYLLI